MGSFYGHALPGTIFILFGFWNAIKLIFINLKRKTKNANGSFRCCGKIPVTAIVIEGVVLLIIASIGCLLEMIIGGPMGRLVSPSGSFLQDNRWYHATMYFFFGLAGVCCILSHTAQHVVPAGLDRLGVSFVFFVEGYLFYLHHEKEAPLIEARVHILLGLSCLISAALLFVQPFLMNKVKCRHIAEILAVMFIIVQGTWFWQAGFIQYPPGAPSWDPCDRKLMPHDGECKHAAEVIEIIKFINMFWTWHVAGSMIFVGILYFLIYQFLKMRRQLDSRFLQPYENLNGKINSSTPLNEALLSDKENHL